MLFLSRSMRNVACRLRQLHSIALVLIGCVLIASQVHSVARGEDLKAEKIYAWEFQRSEDRNVDQWPDAWRRRTGRNFPAFIPIRIVPRDPETARAAREAEPILNRWAMAYQSGNYFTHFIPESTPEPIAQFIDRFLVDSCLDIEMDGGAVELESPVFPLDARFTYTLDASLATRELKGHRVWVELRLLDANNGVVASASTPSITNTTPWQSSSTKAASSELLHSGRIIVHVEPLKSSTLSGNAQIDEIRLYRMPKLELTIDAPHHVALTNQLIDVTCTVLGVHDARSNVNFKLINHLGEVTDSALAPLIPVVSTRPPTGKPESTSTPRAPRLTTTSSQTRSALPKTTTTKSAALPIDPNVPARRNERSDGIAHWELRVSEPGYYRIVVDLGRTVHSADSRQISREASLAIARDTKVGIGGPFGWSIPNFHSQFTPEVVPELVKIGGVGWLKLPVWFEGHDTDMAQRLSLLLDKLDLRKVNCVGVLDQPRDLNDPKVPPQPAALVFNSPDNWEAELEPALTRMSMKLVWFQLGQDHDRSFIGNAALITLITDIRNRMQSYSQELQLVLPWDYQDPFPVGKTLPWRASQMSTEPQLSAKELKSELSEPEKGRTTRWAIINPIPASRYRTLDRVRDLTERMIAVKEHNVEAAFLTTLMSSETGIFNPDGSVGELFLPWRLLNLNLAGASFLGSVNMPGGSTNFVFAEGNVGSMIVWNDRATTEQLFLGDGIEAMDLWGRPLEVIETKSDRNLPEQRLAVTPWPILLRGVSVPVANWRMRFELEQKSLPSTLAQRTEIPITVENTLGRSAVGTVTLSAPSLIQAGVTTTRLQLNAEERSHIALPVPLRNDASAGKHALRFDFQVSSDKEYNFSAYDTLTLGIGDVELQWDTVELTDRNATLRVELTNMSNKSVSFDCKLFPPLQPYRRFQITEAPPGQTVRDILLPLVASGDNSVLWIRCEELGTGRVLNYRIMLTPAGNP